MENIELQLLDADNNSHLQFTYNILKERANKTFVEIDLPGKCRFSLPTLEEHSKFLKNELSKKYLYFYLVSFKGTLFAEIFIDKNLELGIYQSTQVLRQLKRKFGSLGKDNNILVYDKFHEILTRHKKEIPYVIGKINPDNKLSVYGALNLGLTKLYDCYIYYNR